MKFLTAIKKAQKKADQSHGAVECFVRRKCGLNKAYNNDWIMVDLYGAQLDCTLEAEDLSANDWIVEEEIV